MINYIAFWYRFKYYIMPDPGDSFYGEMPDTTHMMSFWRKKNAVKAANAMNLAYTKGRRSMVEARRAVEE